jgi:hypothetical protein
VADSEDALQVSIHSLETFTSKYGLKISTGKVKTVAFTRRDPVRSKIVISNYRTSEHFSYQNETDITVNISKFLEVTGIIYRTLKPSQV